MLHSLPSLLNNLSLTNLSQSYYLGQSTDYSLKHQEMNSFPTMGWRSNAEVRARKENFIEDIGTNIKN